MCSFFFFLTDSTLLQFQNGRTLCFWTEKTSTSVNKMVDTFGRNFFKKIRHILQTTIWPCFFMVSSDFTTKRTTLTAFMQVRMITDIYIYMLVDNLLLEISFITSGSNSFQHNNAFIHVLLASKSWFEANSVNITWLVS